MHQNICQQNADVRTIYICIYLHILTSIPTYHTSDGEPSSNLTFPPDSNSINILFTITSALFFILFAASL